MLYGSARITAIDANGKSFVADVTEGDLWYFPTGIPHSIQGLAPDGAEFLLVFDDGTFFVLESPWVVSDIDVRISVPVTSRRSLRVPSGITTATQGVFGGTTWACQTSSSGTWQKLD